MGNTVLREKEKDLDELDRSLSNSVKTYDLFLGVRRR